MMFINRNSDSFPINAQMVRLAREARGLTQKELATRLSVEQGTLSKIERDQHPVTSAFVDLLSEVLRFPISFFSQQKDTFSPRTVYYRRLVQIPKKSLYQAEAQMDICRFSVSALLREVELSGSNVLKWDIESNGSPEECARYIRQYWQIPKGPISDLTAVSEKNGIIVIHLEMDKSINGFANVADDGQPIIFLNKGMSADRMRFTLAHEIGHLTMHFLDQPIDKDRDTEDEANLFAAELLVPEIEIHGHLRQLDIRRLRELKRFWKVSMQMLLRRAKKLNCIPDHQYRALITKMGYEGYRTNEPIEFGHEYPILAKVMVDTHLQMGYSQQEIEALLHLSAEDIETYFGPSAPAKQPKLRITI
ncbi:MAG: helix-turn-helix domain-containing protein [Janthinobacterium lividum]